MSGNKSPSNSTDTSLSLSPGLLPDKNTASQHQPNEHHSSISEHISSLNSLENDRSLVEIEINNIPDSNVILNEQDSDFINSSPPSSLHLSNSAAKNVKSVLEEILHNDQFKSERSDRLDSNDEISLNIFDGVNLDDSSINNYVLKLCSQQSEAFNYTDDLKVRSLEDALSAKDSIIQVLNVEIESLRDMASNPSTLSLNTTLTEYKQFQEECTTKLVNYENALAHRDAVIGKLKDSIIIAQKREDDMRAECEQYSKDIQCVQKELAEAVEYIKNCKCKCFGKSSKEMLIAYDEEELDGMFKELQDYLVPERLEFVQDVKRQINSYVDSKLNQKQSFHNEEMHKLQGKHIKEMDDTRKFYEKKCADILSDELVSQHSRNVWDDDDDLPSEEEMHDCEGGGDHKPNSLSIRIKTWTPEAVQAFKKKIDSVFVVLNKYDMENLPEEALNSLKAHLESLKLTSLSACETERLYQEQIDALKAELHELQDKQMNDATTQANSGDYEIDGIVKSYQVRLAEQIALAKFDIMSALEENISILAASNCDDDDWPKEFLEIRNKLSEKYIKEISEMKEQHQIEIMHLKQEHLKTLNNAAKRAARRSLDFSDDADVVKERKTTSSLRNLLLESYKYFAQCEEELNSTLFEELAKQSNFDSDSDLNITSTSSSSKTADISTTRRVHLAPNINEFIAKIDSSHENVSLEFKNELGACLDRLKSEANAILALTVKPQQLPSQEIKTDKSSDEKIKSLTVQITAEAHHREELTSQLHEVKQYVKTLENERRNLEKQLEDVIVKNRITEADLAKARDKIGELIEYGRKEIVSEGYGENTLHGGTARTSPSELYDKARQLIVDNKGDTNVLQVVEELCRECDRLVEEAKRERQDFILQIDSADKKLKSTQRFLEEQAVEREQERDEAQKMVSALQEQLRDSEKNRAGYERVNEVPMGTNVTKKRKGCVQPMDAEVVRRVENLELQLHDMSKIIADGEKRYQEINNERDEAIEKICLLRDIIIDLEKQVKVKEKIEDDLKLLVGQQREVNEDLMSQLDAANNSTNFQTHIQQLEEEVSKLRRASDIVGNEGLIKQIQLQLHELELSVDKNIREIESLYATKSTTACSTPSEEMSVQDQIRPKTPNSTVDDCEVPLQQLARLKEKLLKHSRAENSAVRRIQDMEFQLLQAKQELDDLQSEKNVLQEQVSEQLVLISSLQMRLDDQRIRTEHVQKQANASLEMRIYDLENDLQMLRDKLQSRDSTIKQMSKVIEETKQRLKDREEELSASFEAEEVRDMKEEITKLRHENDALKLKMEADAQNAQILPSLVDNIIADKNRDIDALKAKLEDTQKNLELFRSLNSDRTDDASNGVLSFFNVSSPERMRNISVANTPSAMTFLPEISSIEKVGPPNVNYTTDAPLMKPNSTELQKSDRHVHFEDESMQACAETQLLSEELSLYKEKLREAEATASELRVNVAEVKMHLAEKEKEINSLLEDAKRKDDMYVKLAKDKREIEKQFETLDVIKSSIEDLQKNEQQLKTLLEDTKEKFAEKEVNYDKLQKEFDNYKKLKENEVQMKIEESHQRYQQLSKDFNALSKQLEEAGTKHNEEVAKMKHLLEDRECELEILNEDITRYQNEISVLEGRSKISNSEELQKAKNQKELREKELQIVKLMSTIDNLKREIIHLQDYLNEKDKIIATMKVDSEALRINLETIKTKMNEAGNIYDLREKLVQERELNSQLQAENAAFIDEIGDQVRKQLDDSAHLDNKILSALSSGDFNNFSDTELLRSALNKERQSKLQCEEKIKDLETRLNDSLDTIRQLKDSMEEQRKLCDEIQIGDTNLLEQMRGKLEEALENEIEYDSLLNKEKLLRSQLEAELQAIRKKETTSASASSNTEYRSLGNLQEQRLQKELQHLQEEVINLKKEIKILKKTNISLDSNLKQTKYMLNMKEQEVSHLESNIADFKIENKKFKDAITVSKADLTMKQKEIDQREEEKQKLSVRLSILEKQPSMSSTIPDVFLQKMKDLGELVTEHINENKLMTDTIVKLTDDRNKLEARIKELESKDIRLPFDDPVARANHLFGKYLRADSYRHALAFQKKYLIDLLATYQEVIHHPLSKFEPKRRYTKEKGVNRFRSVVVVCIAIFRMKYMVQRWHSGSRSGAYLSFQRKFRNSNIGTHFQVGQPVSGEHFRIGSRQVGAAPGRQIAENQGTSASGIPWSGMSPPSKDVPRNNKQTHNTAENARPPSVELDSYIERFNLIHQRLGMTLNSFNS